jgi:hypothetical protein
VPDTFLSGRTRYLPASPEAVALWLKPEVRKHTPSGGALGKRARGVLLVSDTFLSGRTRYLPASPEAVALWLKPEVQKHTPSGGAWGKRAPGGVLLVSDIFFQGGPGICLQALRRLR